jgi:hypothetical protein
VSYAPVSAKVSAHLSSFVAMQYYWLMLNRTFEVFITDSKLCAARVGGLIASPASVDERWKNPRFYVKPKLRARYEGIDPESPEFLKIDSTNFQISRPDITAVEHHRAKWGMGAVPYSGRILIDVCDGTRCELVLLGTQDAQTILDQLTMSPPNKSLERTHGG